MPPPACINSPAAIDGGFQLPVVDEQQTRPLRGIIQSLLDVVSYVSPREMMRSGNSTEALRAAINQTVAPWAENEPELKVFDKLSQTAASLVEFTYYHHAFEVKLVLGLYSWFAFYLDDVAPPASLNTYHRIILTGGTHTPEPLAHLQQSLTGLYTHWDPFLANIMVTSALDVISASMLENRGDIMQMEPRPTAASWPWYLRTKTSMAAGLASGIFPMAAHPDLRTYIHALPDMDKYLCLVNDILSFYKEDLAGESVNYVSWRAKVEDKAPRRVLVEMVEEVGDLHRRIEGTLDGHTDALAAWTTYEYGLIAWHVSQDRYKLATDLKIVW
ncbi:isoprenoid synthase domain-containing protein [Roridomyces roridus]|uniref:Isoprenoid synthase domain-containing protein n=1 Tax=Roridomyces roridus TaxID=1738132 RepID=A0AAD7BEW2_9AGAR|nr:isoprenoid synthase domain-containing protein [Roridomyces roridus]